ncbi:unnamed protein product, partial [Mesorhabditis belari]|uniref:SCP domain-containing protein n=1 Tax=Mesorhabditis belari TaxID=2138241 RepID=A0AAF3FFI0_9BILA
MLKQLETITQVLDLHNYYRAQHQVGPLKLNNSLNNFAQEWANRLASTGSFNHRSNNRYGENLAMGSGHYGTMQSLVKGWYDEVRSYSFGWGGFSGSTGHFTQLVWRGSKSLGVGIATGRDGSTYLVCNYDPPGNYGGQFQNNVFRKK